ncbi:hypothetical protein BU082_13180, partial [Staphylococcus warneri]
EKQLKKDEKARKKQLKKLQKKENHAVESSTIAGVAQNNTEDTQTKPSKKELKQQKKDEKKRDKQAKKLEKKIQKSA